MYSFLNAQSETFMNLREETSRITHSGDQKGLYLYLASHPCVHTGSMYRDANQYNFFFRILGLFFCVKRLASLYVYYK